MQCDTIVSVNGAAWRAARNASGRSGPDVVFELRQKLPERYWVDSSKLSRFENDKPGTSIDPVALAVMARFFRVELASIDPAAAAELAVVANVATGGDDTIVTYGSRSRTMGTNSGAPHRTKRAAA